ncbi:hypothetical protein EDF22_0608 [Rathayibacter sp. PhB127]|uniref:hypothetical protein n=1 Tax=Rathayibacter sp. PhB127 TaxID=2485176 RepID=UPI000FB475C6|nr:hypothetical protein [Rathayibacter sp. PhB127]ROS28877.1 hypothetical protein EDF22_0608 [Rathayibacter sp. PhB127]
MNPDLYDYWMSHLVRASGEMTYRAGLPFDRRASGKTASKKSNYSALRLAQIEKQRAKTKASRKASRANRKSR